MNKIRTISICILITAVMILSTFPTMAAETYDAEKLYTGPKQVYREENRGRPSNPGKPDKPPKEEEGPQPDPSVNKWAVVIGISDYRGRSNDLMYCDDDAQDMYAYLITKGYPEGNIRLLINKDASAKNIVAAIEWLDSWEGKGSEVVFFYSGHGSTYDGYNDGDGEYTDEGIVSADLWLILDGQLQQMFSNFNSLKISYTFDTCFSGGMDDLKGPGRIVVAACGEEESSYDGTSEQQNGVFTYFYMEGLNICDTVEGAFIYASPLSHDFMENYEIEMNPQIYDQYEGEWKF